MFGIQWSRQHALSDLMAQRAPAICLPVKTDDPCMDGQGIKRLAPGLPESSSEPILSPATVVFCPVFPPHVGPQGQLGARVGPVTRLVVERHLYPRWFVSFPQESVRSNR